MKKMKINNKLIVAASSISSVAIIGIIIIKLISIRKEEENKNDTGNC